MTDKLNNVIKKGAEFCLNRIRVLLISSAASETKKSPKINFVLRLNNLVFMIFLFYIELVIALDHRPVAMMAKINRTLFPIIPTMVYINFSCPEPLLAIFVNADLSKNG